MTTTNMKALNIVFFMALCSLHCAFAINISQEKLKEQILQAAEKPTNEVVECATAIEKAMEDPV